MLIFIYSLLLLGNLLLVILNKKNKFIAIFSFVVLLFLFCGHEYVGNGDSNDFLGYLQDYDNVAVTTSRDFWFYYLFYCTQIFSKLLGLNFYQWWAIMTYFALRMLWVTNKRFNLNIHHCLLWIMAYYGFILYTGLKFFYGFCFMFLACCNLFHESDNGNKKFILYTLLAGGMHVMYYFFLILLFNKVRFLSPKKVFILSIISFVFMLIGGKGLLMTFLGPLVYSLNSDNLNQYFTTQTNLGFLIPLTIHFILLVYIFIVDKIYSRKPVLNNESCTRKNNAYKLKDTKIILNSTLLLTLIYPLFLVSLTFNRIYTAYSLILIMISSTFICNFSKLHRMGVLFFPFLIIVIYYIFNFYLNNYIDSAVIPLFDNYFYNYLFGI